MTFTGFKAGKLWSREPHPGCLTLELNPGAQRPEKRALSTVLFIEQKLDFSEVSC